MAFKLASPNMECEYSLLGVSCTVSVRYGLFLEPRECGIWYHLFCVFDVCSLFNLTYFCYRIRCSCFVSVFNGIALRNRYFNFRKSIRSIDASSWSLLVLFKVFFFFHVSQSDFPYRSCKCSFSVFCLFSYLVCCRPHIIISFFFGKVLVRVY